MQEEGQSRSYLIPLLLLYLLYSLGTPLWGVGVAGLWYFGLLYLEDNGSLDKLGISRVLGIVLMIRTKHGQDVLEKISRNRRFWRGFGEMSIWLCLFVMLGVVALLVLTAISTAMAPPEEYLPASDLLLIPGVNSFVPFWWPVLALVFALVIHEYSHGIQARAHGMRVSSFGLLLAGPVPIGAFAEPQMHEMIRAPRRERMRLYAAGPSINLLAAWLVLILLSSTAANFETDYKGVHASHVIKDTGAEEAGLLPYETITHIDGVAVFDYDAFSEVMTAYSAGDSAMFSVLPSPFDDNQEPRRIEVLLTDRHFHYMLPCLESSDCDVEEYSQILANELGIHEGDAFVGIQVAEGTSAADIWSVAHNNDLSITQRGLWLLTAPFFQAIGTPILHDGHTMNLEQRAMLTAGDGAIASTLGTEGMLALFDFLFWLVWINFLLGFANLIPMVPFDGGHIVRDGTHSILARLNRNMHPMRLESLANRISSMSSILVLIIVAVPIILPRLVG